MPKELHLTTAAVPGQLQPAERRCLVWEENEDRDIPTQGQLGFMSFFFLFQDAGRRQIVSHNTHSRYENCHLWPGDGTCFKVVLLIKLHTGPWLDNDDFFFSTFHCNVQMQLGEKSKGVFNARKKVYLKVVDKSIIVP